MNVIHSPELLTFEQAGERIRCEPTTIDRLVRQGFLPEVRVTATRKQAGPLIRKVRRADLDELVRTHGNWADAPAQAVDVVRARQRWQRSNPDFTPPTAPLRSKVQNRGFSKP